MPYKDKAVEAWHKRNRERHLETNRRAKHNLRLKIQSYKIQCAECGYNRSPVALDFHHPSGADKEVHIAQLRYGWERIKKEIDKCVVLCANCHRIRHFTPGAGR